jgi:hypothetical protein
MTLQENFGVARQCEVGAMLRPLLLALASGLLVAACALVDPPAPAGTVMLQINVNDQSACRST